MSKISLHSMDYEEAFNLRHELAQVREANQKLQLELAQVSKLNENLQASHFYQKDEIRYLKSDARSKEQEITRLNQQLLVKLQPRSSEEDIPAHKKSGQMVENLRASIQAREVEIRVLREDALSYTEEINKLNHKVRALKEGLRSHGEEVTTLNREVEVLKEGERSNRRKIASLDENVGALREGERSYREEIATLKENVHRLEEVAAEESPFVPVGKDVRLRFLEHQAPRHSGKDQGRIKSGNRAAHRGRPVVDALLCVNGEVEDPRVIRKAYEVLYGVSPELLLKWKDVPEMVEVTSFRGSLQCNRQLTEEFRGPFDRLKGLAIAMSSNTELRDAFAAKGQVNDLPQLYAVLLHCFDKFVAEQRLEPTISFGRRGF